MPDRLAEAVKVCRPATPFGCNADWGDESIVSGYRDMRQHICKHDDPRHVGAHLCECGAVHRKDE